MDQKFIKRHTASETFIVKKCSFFENDIVFPGNTIVGVGSNFWGNLVVKGTLELGKGSTVKGDVIADAAVIGGDCSIGGNIKVRGDLKILDRTHIGGLAYSGADLMVRPMVTAREVESEGDLEVTGKTDIKQIRSGRKIVARKI